MGWYAIIAEREARQLVIVVQGSRIVYLLICVYVILRNASTSFSILMKPTSSLQYQDMHELLFIIARFMVQKDYGFWGCTINVLTMLWVYHSEAHVHSRIRTSILLWHCRQFHYCTVHVLLQDSHTSDGTSPKVSHSIIPSSQASCSCKSSSSNCDASPALLL